MLLLLLLSLLHVFVDCDGHTIGWNQFVLLYILTDYVSCVHAILSMGISLILIQHQILKIIIGEVFSRPLCG